MIKQRSDDVAANDHDGPNSVEESQCLYEFPKHRIGSLSQ
jgi:hypothetical protein